MVEPVGLASGLLTLATFAFDSSISLYQTIKSFGSHQQRVQDLAEELDALGGVLNSLRETVNAISGADLSALNLPLLRCGNTCKDFERELLKCSSRSRADRTSFRDWAKLKYMGDDVDGFRRSLTGYKLTISIALTDLHLRKSSATAESIEVYNGLLNTARADLEDRLERMDEKLELILGQDVTESESDGSEVRVIKEERLSTIKCLQICAQLSEHIHQIQLSAKRSTGHDGPTESATLPAQITHEGLQDCKDSIARTAAKLEGHEQQLFGRLIDKMKNAKISEEERTDLARLRDELAATRQGIDVCSKAHEHLKDNVSTIDNYATGDAVQFMVSTREKTIHGKNRGLGWRTRQVGGHISDESLQQIARSLTSMTIPLSRTDLSPSLVDRPVVPDISVEPRNSADSKFKEQYGKGFKLTSKDGDDTVSGTDPTEDKSGTSRKV